MWRLVADGRNGDGTEDLYELFEDVRGTSPTRMKQLTASVTLR